MEHLARENISGSVQLGGVSSTHLRADCVVTEGSYPWVAEEGNQHSWGRREEGWEGVGGGRGEGEGGVREAL